MKIEIRGRVRVHPTEDLKKVKEAIFRIIQNPTILVQDHGKFQELVFTAQDTDAITKIKTIIAQDQIRNAARKALLSSLSNNVFDFYINKQVAYASHISFCQPVGESPLGPIHINIETDEPKSLVNWIAPSPEQRERYRKHAEVFNEESYS